MSFVGVHVNPFSPTQCYMGPLFFVCALVLMTGCEQAGSPRDAVSPPPVVEKVDENVVTSAEAEKFAKKYSTAINKQRTRELLELVYWDAIVDRVFNGLSTESAVYKEYSLAAKNILGGFSKGVHAETKDGGSYSLLKIVRRGKDRHAIFRLVTGASTPAGGGRINYHNLRLIKRRGQVSADDIYIASTGSWFSETYRSAIQPALLQSEKSAAGFTSLQREEMEGYQRVAAMVTAARSGKHAEAAELFDQLPEDAKKTKVVLTARMLATERDEFFAATEAMLSQYPGSTAAALSMMDFGMRQKDLPTLKRASELLKKWTAGDPYIDLNVAAVMSSLGQVDEAAELSKEIDVRKFGFIHPVYQKYKIALASKDNKVLLECFRIFRDDYGEDIKKVLESEECQNFVESLEYLDLKND